MSIFRIIKYSSLLYFFGKHRDKLVRSVAVLLFAFVSSLIYDDVRVYLAQQHPGTLIYALIAKIVIVYGSLVFVLLQFRSSAKVSKEGEARAADLPHRSDKAAASQSTPRDRLDALADVEHHERLRSRYDRILSGERSVDPAGKTSPRESQ
ncbi:hypothetical protein R0135_10835 [Congregibacter variabilis]|uniref:Integral membrane protein n=1 Tax=Congregibacter variabilis TaxID=3081200 RepID=A0ABZ0I167_9GAMM|nr:hypothetical protein R0135_10835 [Congregibacter sp. IMCC43200]